MLRNPTRKIEQPNDRCSLRQQGTASFGPFSFDRSELVLSRKGRPIHLPERSLRLLEALLRAPHTTWSKDRLIAEAWPDSHVTDTSLTEAISRLRSALGDQAREPTYIETVHGRGYRFIAGVRELARSPVQRASRQRNIRRAAAVAIASFAAAGFVVLISVFAFARPGALRARLADASISVPALLIDPLQGLGRYLLGLASPSPPQADPLYRLARVTSDGSRLVRYSVPPMPLNGFSVDPTQGRIAFSVRDDDESDAWIYEPNRGALKRIATGGFFSDPVWSPAGDALVLAARRKGDVDLVLRSVDRPGVEETLLARPLDQFPESWSADGSVLIFAEDHPDTGYDLWALERGTDRSWRPRPLVRSPNDEAFGAISPDGRWVAYVERGEGPPAVFLTDLSSAQKAIRVSGEGGSYPFWSPDGTRLHFLVDEQVRTLTVNGLDRAPETPVEATQRIAGLYLAGFGGPGGGYTVAMLQ